MSHHTFAALLLLCGALSLPAQPPFVCDGTFYLVLAETATSNSTLYRVVVDGTGSGVLFEAISQPDMGTQVNPMGYRISDNYIYTMHPLEHQLYRVGADGLAQPLGQVQGVDPSRRYNAGDVTPDGHYLVITVYDNVAGLEERFMFLDLETLDLQPSYVDLVSASSGLQVPHAGRSSDFAIHPFTGEAYGFDQTHFRLLKYDIYQGIVYDTLYPVVDNVLIVGGLFFDSFGDLYGYGLLPGETLQRTLYRIDLESGQLEALGNGPPAQRIDGCSCPYTIESQVLVGNDWASPCDSVDLFVRVANASGLPQGGISLCLPLPPGVAGLSVADNPFGGTASTVFGTFCLSDALLPIGLDSLHLRLALAPDAPASLPFQAYLSGLPAVFGGNIVSDNPATLAAADATPLHIIQDDTLYSSQHLRACAGDTLWLSASRQGAYAHAWSSGADTTPSIAVTEPGLYVASSTGCLVQVDSFFVAYDSLRLAAPQVAGERCAGAADGEALPLWTSGTAPLAWWLDGLPAVLAEGRLLGLAPGSYHLRAIDALGCADSLLFEVPPAPLFALDAGPAAEIRLGDSLQLSPSWVGAVDSLRWSPAEWLSCAACPQPWAVPPASTWLHLTAWSALGCRASDSLFVQVRPFREVYFPNAFSPNNDGQNDYFYAQGRPIAELLRLEVYDRWGGLLFSRSDLPLNDPAAGWDGRHGGQEAAPGVYVWWAELRYRDGKRRIVQGDVLLLR